MPHHKNDLGLFEAKVQQVEIDRQAKGIEQRECDFLAATGGSILVEGKFGPAFRGRHGPIEIQQFLHPAFEGATDLRLRTALGEGLPQRNLKLTAAIGWFRFFHRNTA